MTPRSRQLSSKRVTGANCCKAKYIKAKEPTKRDWWSSGGKMDIGSYRWHGHFPAYDLSSRKGWSSEREQGSQPKKEDPETAPFVGAGWLSFPTVISFWGSALFFPLDPTVFSCIGAMTSYTLLLLPPKIVTIVSVTCRRTTKLSNMALFLKYLGCYPDLIWGLTECLLG